MVIQLRADRLTSVEMIDRAATIITNQSAARAEILAKVFCCHLPPQLRLFYIANITIGLTAAFGAFYFSSPIIILWVLPIAFCGVVGTQQLRRETIRFASISSFMCTFVWFVIASSLNTSRVTTTLGCDDRLCEYYQDYPVQGDYNVSADSCEVQYVFDRSIEEEKPSEFTKEEYCSYLLYIYAHMFWLAIILGVLLMISCCVGSSIPLYDIRHRPRSQYGAWYTTITGVIPATTITHIHPSRGGNNVSRSRRSSDVRISVAPPPPINYVVVMQPSGDAALSVQQPSLSPSNKTNIRDVNAPDTAKNGMVNTRQLELVCKNATSSQLVKGILTSTADSARADSSGVWIRSQPEIIRICSEFKRRRPDLWSEDIAVAYRELLVVTTPHSNNSVIRSDI